MTRNILLVNGCLLSVVFALAALPMGAGFAADTPATAAPTDWTAPTAEAIDAIVMQWLETSAESPEEASDMQTTVRPVLDRLYGSADRLDVVAECLALTSPQVADLVAQAYQNPIAIQSLDWLDTADIPYWVRNNLHLLVGRCLVQNEYYEQGLAAFEGIATDDVFDPASLLFYRSIAQHQLVQVDEAKTSLSVLLDAEQPLPERFVQVARLMQADIAQVEQDSLDHIARRMSDVERRLSLGEANDRAQEVERGIIESLDKMIDKLEQQQQQQQQQQANSQPSGQPMEDSKPAELKTAGKVDVKDIGDGSGWGDLPPRERERVMQQIGRDFPGHYRDLMEEYLKRLATDERDEEQP